MKEGDPRNDPAMQERVARFIASGEDPNGHYVSAETLLRVIGEVGDVSEETRSKVVEAIQGLIVPGNFVDSLQLGMAFGRLLGETRDTQGVWAIAKDTKNLDKVPIVNIRGQAVN